MLTPSSDRQRRRRSVSGALVVLLLVAALDPGAAAEGPSRRAAGVRGTVRPAAAWPVRAAPRSLEVAMAPARFDGAPPAPLAQPAVSGARSGGVWALVIGVDDYPGTKRDLRGSVRDADTVDAALAVYGVGSERRLVLRDGQATAATIRAALQWLVDRAGDDATAVVFYAGHVRTADAGRESIVAADGQLLADTEVAARLQGLGARRTWIAIAGCYAGGFTEVLAPGRILTGAAAAGDLAYENPSYGGSYLVEFMVRRAMLEGRAPASIEQSFAWAEAELRRQHPDRVPVQYDRADGEIALGLPPPATPAPAEPAPASSPAPASHPPDDGDGGGDAGDRCLLTVGSVVGCG